MPNKSKQLICFDCSIEYTNNSNNYKCEDGNTRCKQCKTKHHWREGGKAKENQKLYRKTKNYQKVRRNCAYNYRYGISLEEYNQLYAMQNGLCKICEQQKDLHVDHDHKTGVVRGLLCTDCNKGLGLMRDDIIILSNAIKYLSAGILK